MLNRLRRQATGGFLGLAACVAAAHAQTAPFIQLTPLQIERAGITIERVGKSAGTDGNPGAGGLRLSGTAVLPNQAIRIASVPLSGTVQSIEVNSMQEVAAGRTLARLYSPQLLEWQRDYVQLHAQAELAATKLRRDEELFREGIIAEKRLQESRSAHMRAAVAARERRQSLKLVGVGEASLASLASDAALFAHMNVPAPASGTVLEILATAGQRLDAGAPIAKIGNTRMLWLELQASREQSGQVALGSAVAVEGCSAAGRVTAIGTQVNAANQNVILRAELRAPERCLRLNQYVEATVATRAAAGDVFAVRPSALVQQGGRDYVFVREPAGFRPVAVTAQSRAGDRVAVRGALKPGSAVAVSGLAALKGAWLGLGTAGAPQAHAPGKAAAK